MDLERLKTLDDNVAEKGIDNLTESELADLFAYLYEQQEKELILDMIDYGLNVNARNNFYENLLNGVIDAGDLEFTRILVEKGANPFQINNRGLTNICMLLRGENEFPEEFCYYLFELGLNPYNEFGKGIFYKRLTTEGVTINRTLLKGASPFSKPDLDYKSAIFNGDLNGALFMLENILNHIGPLREEAKLTPFIQDILSNYRAVLYFTGNEEKAQILGEYLNEKHVLSDASSRIIRYNLMNFALFAGDKENYDKFKTEIRRFDLHELNVVATYVLDCLYLMLTNGSDNKKKKAINQMKEYYIDSNYEFVFDHLILKIFSFNEEEDLVRMEELLKDTTIPTDAHLKICNLYMVYLIEQKKYTEAKYIAMKLRERKMDFFALEWYFLNLLLLKYIDELEMSTE